MNIFKYLMCRFKKRHTKAQLLLNMGAMHQFFDQRRGGVHCKCPLCGYRVIFYRRY